MSTEQTTRPVSVASDDPHTRLFMKIIRDCAREGGIIQPVSDEDARAALKYFECPDEDYRPMPDTEGPEFFAELQRRAELPHPRIDARNVSAFLRQRWGQGTP